MQVLRAKKIAGAGTGFLKPPVKGWGEKIVDVKRLSIYYRVWGSVNPYY